jgi:hypothetical protein
MSALLKIKDEDNRRIEKLQKLLAKTSKVEVVREALVLLEEKIERDKKIKRYQRAAKLVAASSAEVNQEFMDSYRLESED